MKTSPKAVTSKLRNIVLFWGFGASGAAGLIYEVAWQRAITNTIGSTSYSISILFAAFMAGLAIGSHFSGKWFINQKDFVKIFGRLQLATAFFGLATYFLINNLQPVYGGIHGLVSQNPILFNLSQMILVFAVLLMPTTLMGASLPVIIEAWMLRVRDAGQTAGDMYSINTWGAAAGALAAGFILVPLLGLRATNLAAVLINLLLALGAFIAAGLSPPLRKTVKKPAVGIVAEPAGGQKA